MPNIDLSLYYLPDEAAAILSRNSKKNISPAYLRQLVRYGAINSIQLGPRMHVYLRSEIDNYKVEERGAKSARAAKEKAAKKVA